MERARQRMWRCEAYTASWNTAAYAIIFRNDVNVWQQGSVVIKVTRYLTDSTFVDSFLIWMDKWGVCFATDRNSRFRSPPFTVSGLKMIVRLHVSWEKGKESRRLVLTSLITVTWISRRIRLIAGEELYPFSYFLISGFWILTRMWLGFKIHDRFLKLLEQKSTLKGGGERKPSP